MKHESVLEYIQENICSANTGPQRPELMMHGSIRTIASLANQAVSHNKHARLFYLFTGVGQLCNVWYLVCKPNKI